MEDSYRNTEDPYRGTEDSYRNPGDPYRNPGDPYGNPEDPYRGMEDPYRDPDDPYRDTEDSYRLPVVHTEIRMIRTRIPVTRTARRMTRTPRWGERGSERVCRRELLKLRESVAGETPAVPGFPAVQSTRCGGALPLAAQRAALLLDRPTGILEVYRQPRPDGYRARLL